MNTNLTSIQLEPEEITTNKTEDLDIGSRSFRSFAEVEMVHTQEDETYTIPPVNTNTQIHSVYTRASISDLFTFTLTPWVEKNARTQKNGFDEELELFELLDLDADGDVDGDIPLDEAMEEILTA